MTRRIEATKMTKGDHSSVKIQGSRASAIGMRGIISKMTSTNPAITSYVIKLYDKVNYRNLKIFTETECIPKYSLLTHTTVHQVSAIVKPIAKEY